MYQITKLQLVLSSGPQVQQTSSVCTSVSLSRADGLCQILLKLNRGRLSRASETPPLLLICQFYKSKAIAYSKWQRFKSATT
jgi:hypothetical protein